MPVSRRKFIQSASALGASALLSPSPNDVFSSEKPAFAGKIPVKVLATNWGFQGSWDDFCRKAKASGYDGFEAWIPFDEKDRNALLEAAAKHGLEFGFLAGAGAFEFEEHLKIYEKGVRLAASLQPLYVNTHAGRDFFTFDQNKKILETGLRVAAETGVPVLCETHRGRCAFSAPATRQYLDAIPGLRLTADLSHWCCVHESLLGGFADTLELALGRTDHVHARVGHAEGPQVNDPRAPEWSDAVKTHFIWWDKIVEKKTAAGARHMTFLAEFGPPHYLPALPYTLQPVANQWDVNVHMMKLLRERYG